MNCACRDRTDREERRQVTGSGLWFVLRSCSEDEEGNSDVKGHTFKDTPS